MKLNRRTVFLLDGAGAVLSAVATGLVMPMFHERTGVPNQILYALGGLAVMFATFSLSCYQLGRPTQWMLKAIIAANLSYCLITSLLILNLKGVTVWGLAYLITEIVVVLAVVTLEIQVLRRRI